MINSLTKKRMALAISCAFTLAIVPGLANTQSNVPDTQFLKDQRGMVTKSAYGLCWQTGNAASRESTAECDPNFVPAPIAAVVAPPRVEPAPVAVAPPPPVVEPAPAVVPPPPPPPPVAVVAPEPPPKPTITRVTLETDTLFDFNKAELRPAGRAALDDFVAKLGGVDIEVIMATGHADRLGPTAYNQRLSEKRAEAAKNYLVSRGLESKRAHIEAKGEMQPATKAGDCNVAAVSKLIDCLQPDRRVEIEVVGTRIVK